jgi:hypothetical protein
MRIRATNVLGPTIRNAALCAAALFAFFTNAAGQILTKSAPADTTVYSERSNFLAVVSGDAVTDDYSGYGVDSGTAPRQLSDSDMSSVIGETRYESTSFVNFNLVGNVYAHGDGTNYCAGCNGNFRLHFDQTSFTKRKGEGVFGVGLDILLHTSRHTALGDVNPAETSLEGTILVEFGDGEIRSFVVPPDVGFFGADPYFFGLTDRRGIRAITVGTEPLALRHSWVIDNLTIGGPRRGKRP